MITFFCYISAFIFMSSFFVGAMFFSQLIYKTTKAFGIKSWAYVFIYIVCFVICFHYGMLIFLFIIGK